MMFISTGLGEANAAIARSRERKTALYGNAGLRLWGEPFR
jgi:hypothetical protein